MAKNEPTAIQPMQPMTVNELKLLLGDKEILIAQLIRENQMLHARIEALTPKEKVPSKKKDK